MDHIVEAAELANLREGKLHPSFPLGLPVLIVRRGEELFAVENRCAHMGCPLTAGVLDGYILQCPCHDWRFDIRSGISVDAPELSIKTYAAHVLEGKVFIRMTK
jgi:nitrite reductase/ring-hydroxylating ferredoxin subunit